TFIKTKGILIYGHPIGFFLRGNCFNITQLATAKNTDKNFTSFSFTSGPIRDIKFLSCKIHKELIASLMLHMHTDFALFTPMIIMMAKLAVFIAFFMALSVFFPKQLQGDPYLFKLLFKIREKLF